MPDVAAHRAAAVTASYLLIASAQHWRNVLHEIKWRWTVDGVVDCGMC